MGKLRFDRITLDYQARRRAADGSLIVPGLFARSGCQTYHNADGSERIEYRAAEMVRASASTFEGVSICDEHPTSFVSADNWAQLAKGHVQGIEAVDEDGECWLKGLFHFKSRDLVDRVERGERPELSAGYYADEVDSPGLYKGQSYHCEQANVVGNHVASIAGGTARAGRGARLLLDSTGNQLPPGDRRDGQQQEMSMDEFEVVLGGVTYKVKADTTARQALTAHLAQAQGLQAAVDTQRTRADGEATKVVTLTAERDTAKGRADALATEVADLRAKLADATDTKRIDALVKARAELVEKARRLGGHAIDTTGTDHELKIRALDAAGVKLSDDQRKSAAYVDARLDAAIERQQELRDAGELTIDEVLGGRADALDTTDPLDEVFEARARYLADQRNDRGED